MKKVFSYAFGFIRVHNAEQPHVAGTDGAHILKSQREGNRPQCGSWYAFETIKPTPVCNLILPKTVTPTQVFKHMNLWEANIIQTAAFMAPYYSNREKTNAGSKLEDIKESMMMKIPYQVIISGRRKNA